MENIKHNSYKVYKLAKAQLVIYKYEDTQAIVCKSIYCIEHMTEQHALAVLMNWDCLVRKADIPTDQYVLVTFKPKDEDIEITEVRRLFQQVDKEEYFIEE